MNTEQERAELLPCPFCGGEPSITKQMGESLWSHDIVLWTQVQCDGCEAHVGPTCEGFEVEAVDIWNRRAALQSQERDDAEFELLQDDTVMASTSGKREDAWREIQHYAAVYSQDDPVEIYEVIRRRIEGEAK